jgi:hypothetical protein
MAVFWIMIKMRKFHWVSRQKIPGFYVFLTGLRAIWTLVEGLLLLNAHLRMIFPGRLAQ